MPSKFFQPFSTHLTIRLLHRRRDRHWAPLDPNQPHQFCICYLNGFLNAYKKINQKRANLFAEPAAPQEPPAEPRDGFRAEMCTLCAHGQDTCLAPTCSSPGLETTPFLQHQGTEAVKRKVRGAVQPSGHHPPQQQFRVKSTGCVV